MPNGLTPAQRSIRARIGALTLHATHDTLVVSLPGRQAFLERFEREVDPNNELPAEERERRARYARSAYFQKLRLQRARKNTAARRGQKRTAEGESAAVEIATEVRSDGAGQQQPSR